MKAVLFVLFIVRLEKSNRVIETYAAPDFRREFLDKRQVISIFLVEQIVSVHAEDVRVMVASDDV